jgi:hypothetical protein
MNRGTALLVMATLSVVLGLVNLALLAYLLAFVREVEQVAETVREFAGAEATLLGPAVVEADVAAQFEEREGIGITLSCPAVMRVEVGANYQCSGTTAGGEAVTLVIEVTNEESPAYTWNES